MLVATVVWVVHTPPIRVHHAPVNRSIRTFVVGGTISAFYCGITICRGIRERRETFTSLVLGAQNFTMENSVLEFNGKSTPVADRQKRVKAYCGLPIALYRRQRKRVLSQRLLLARGTLGGT